MRNETPLREWFKSFRVATMSGRISCIVLPFVLLLAVTGGGGCTTVKPLHVEPNFYPPPPLEPRLQFLTSYSQPDDIEPPPSAMMTFLVGELPPRPPMLKPYGLALHDGTIYVCDTVSAAIHLLDLDDGIWETFRPKGQGALRKVINLDVDVDGTRYVTDTLRRKVMIYSAEGQFLGSLGGEEELKPTDVKVSGDRIYVTDLKSQSVRIYDKRDRIFLDATPSDTENDSQRLFAPTNLDIDDSGRLYVSDSGAFRIQLYDAEGRYVRSFGRHGDQPGAFARNKGLAVDREGRLYVVDAGFENVQIFDPDGNLLLFFASPDTGTGSLTLPASILVDYDHNHLFRQYVAPGFELEYVVIVTSQYGPRKVNVYGFIHRSGTTDEGSQSPSE